VKKDAYKKIAGRYDIFVEPLVKSLRAATVKMIPSRKGMRVLDVGCGTGTYLKFLKSNGYMAFGIDSSFAMMNIAKAKPENNVRLLLGDALNLPCSDSTFDLVTFFMVLHEMPETERITVFSEAKRVMKENGRILVVDYLPGPIQSVKGYLLKLVITFYEIAAGLEHFKNYQNFLFCRGLYSLIEKNRLSVEKKKISTGGNIGLFLIR